MIQAIIDGNMEFAIDQQQYLQGYLPIVFLKLYHDNLNTVGGGLPVYTGPGFVTAENAEQVLELTGEGHADAQQGGGAVRPPLRSEGDSHDGDGDPEGGTTDG